MILRTSLAAALLLSAGLAAHAAPLTGAFTVTATEGLGPTGGFDTKNGNPYTGSNTASATFTYTGAINFSSTAAQNTTPAGDLNTTFFGSGGGTLSGYTGTGTVMSGTTTDANFATLASFLASSGSAGTFAYGSYYTFDLGTLLSGTVLSITHDDGVSLFEGGAQIGSTVSGPTAVTTDMVTVGTTGDVILRYARENGTPSILTVNAATAATPEPSSIALLGTGLLGVAGVVRKRFAA